MITIEKDIKVFGFPIRKGSKTKLYSEGSEIVLLIGYTDEGFPYECPIICTAYKKTASEFLNEICIQNSGHKSYKLYLESQK